MVDIASFDEHGTLPGHLINSAKQAVQFVDYFVVPESQKFEWMAFKDAVDNRPETDMIVEQYDGNNIDQHNDALEAVVDIVAELLCRVGGRPFDKDVFAGGLIKAFTGLYEKEHLGVAHYDEQGGNAGFTYRVLFIVPDSDASTAFYGLVSTVKLMAADINSKEGWFGLVRNSRQDFSAEVNMMKLACHESFQAGPRPSS